MLESYQARPVPCAGNWLPRVRAQTNSKAYRCYNRKTQHVHITWNVEFIESQDEVPRPLSAAQAAKKDTGDENPADPVLEFDVPGSESPIEEEIEPDVDETEEEPEPATRPTRTRKGRGGDGAFPDERKDAAVQEARAAEARAKERRAEAKTQWASIQDGAEEEHANLPEDGEFEYWALTAAFAEEWRKAYQAELDSIKEHGVYELVPPGSVPNGRKIIRSRPVFKIKHGRSNEILHPVLNPSAWCCMREPHWTTR
ncbi:hypothetical protein FB451DRAFT_1258935 [Mycena latifolia]|nr:hypothetical protein FB451DRAFT_1258935 [Mycena latifolia]